MNSAAAQGRIILADDHPLFRAALSAAVQRVSPQHTIVETSSLEETDAALKAGAADLVGLDLHMEDSAGFIGLAELRKTYPSVPIVVISASQTPGVAARAIEFGAAGFIPKTADMDTLCEALEAVLEGDVWVPDGADDADEDVLEAAAKIALLTPAQMRVLSGLAEGRLNKQIAYDMSISEATVKAHVTAIFRKLGVINRTQAVLVAQALVVEPPTET